MIDLDRKYAFIFDAKIARRLTDRGFQPCQLLPSDKNNIQLVFKYEITEDFKIIARKLGL